VHVQCSMSLDIVNGTGLNVERAHAEDGLKISRNVCNYTE